MSKMNSHKEVVYGLIIAIIINCQLTLADDAGVDEGNKATKISKRSDNYDVSENSDEEEWRGIDSISPSSGIGTSSPYHTGSYSSGGYQTNFQLGGLNQHYQNLNSVYPWNGAGGNSGGYSGYQNLNSAYPWYGTGGNSGSHSGYQNLNSAHPWNGAGGNSGGHSGAHYPVPYQVPVSYPVPLKIRQPLPIQIPVPVPLERTVTIPVERTVPYPVEKPVPYNVIRNIPVPVPQPYPVPVPVYRTKIIVHGKSH